jgi:hypothetical protein
MSRRRKPQLLLLHRSCCYCRLSSTVRHIYHVSQQALNGKDRAYLEPSQIGGASLQSRMRPLQARHCQN